MQILPDGNILQGFPGCKETRDYSDVAFVYFLVTSWLSTKSGLSAGTKEKV
jgi:hypothetical protein